MGLSDCDGRGSESVPDVPPAGSAMECQPLLLLFQQRPGSFYLRGRAAAQGRYYPGGQFQRYILDPVKDLLP